MPLKFQYKVEKCTSSYGVEEDWWIYRGDAPDLWFAAARFNTENIEDIVDPEELERIARVTRWVTRFDALGLRLQSWAGPGLVWDSQYSPDIFVTPAELELKMKARGKEEKQRKKKERKGNWRAKWLRVQGSMGQIAADFNNAVERLILCG